MYIFCCLQRLFQDAFDSLGWVNKLSQLIEGGAQLSHVRVLPLLAKLEPLRRKISFLDKVKSGPHSSTSGCNILPRTDTRHACPRPVGLCTGSVRRKARIHDHQDPCLQVQFPFSDPLSRRTCAQAEHFEILGGTDRPEPDP